MDFSRDTIEVNDCLLDEVKNENSSGSQLDEARFCLTWENLTVRITEKSPTLLEKMANTLSTSSEPRDRRFIEILKSASGYAEAGDMIAVMGPSGAGKTSLLDALAKRTRPSSGGIRVNGDEISSDFMTKISGYVPQHDCLPATLTAGEYIAFSCALRLDRTATARDRELLARDVIENLGLGECRNSVTGVLSGGERKRLSLAAEIITRPRILFLDEPTTGLDTSAALRVVESLRLVSTDGIVICSIHQPSMMIYNLFSRVIFLSKGETAFSGSLDDARLFFESEGFRPPIGFDEAEYYVKVLSGRILEDHEFSSAFPSLEVEDHTARISRAYASSDFAKIPELRGSPGKPNWWPDYLVLKGPRWMVQINWLLWRHYLDNRRSIVDGLIAFQYYAISIVTIGIFFWGIDTHKQRGIQDVMGVLYMASSETIFWSAYAPLYEIQREISLYRREAGVYGPSAYYVATAINWIPKAMLKSLLLSITLFALLGTRATFFPTFLQFFACTAVSGICGTAYGIMMASFFDDNEIATAVMVPLDLAGLLMAGVYYSLRKLRWYTVIFKYISIFYYTNEALAIAHWSQVGDIECDSDANLPCISTGSQVLLEHGYGESNFWVDIAGMGVLTILMNFMGYLGTRRRRRTKSAH